MNYDIRVKIMQEWCKHGENALNKNNSFEAFIYLWIAWVIGCKVFYSNNYRYTNELKDKELLLKWCKSDVYFFEETINSHKNTLSVLKNRVVGINRDPIINCHTNAHKRQAMIRLSKFWSNRYDYRNKNDLINDFLSLIVTVRNNLFHGDKAYDDKSDRELINALLPTLLALTKGCVN